MICPDCQHPKSDVLDKRGLRRRRKCQACGCRFSTVETIVGSAPACEPAPVRQAKTVAPKLTRRIKPKAIETHEILRMEARRRVEDLFEARRLGLSIDYDDAEGLGLC